MAQIIWTEPALLDLDGIVEYIALDDVLAAKKLAQDVFQSVERLESFPDSGRKPPELEHSKYFEVVSRPCRIFYRIESDFVYILYVMRVEQALRKYLIDGRLEKLAK